MSEASGGSGGEKARDQVIDNLAAAMERLRAALQRLGDEVEANAQAEWVRAKPELRGTVTDLQRMVDALAERAKAALGELGSRLDGPPKQEG
jgi:hypothetical protein